jgi:hypothetical protein
MSELDRLLENIRSTDASSQLKSGWQPEYQGDIDIRIDADGSWYHQGRKFQRESLVKLFAGILRREKNEYFLVTPAEKLRIQVDDAAFVAVLVEQVEDHGKQAIVFTTNIGDKIILDKEHPIRVEINPITEQPRPYLMVRAGLEALINRSAFYELVNMASEVTRNQHCYLAVSSMGIQFELGVIS